MRSKKYIFLAAVLALLLCASLIEVPAISADKMSAPIASALENGDQVHVVIKMKDKSSQDSPLSASSLEENEIGKKYVSHSTNDIYGEISAATLEKLMNDPNVESVEYSPRVYATLQDSVKQIRANDTWIQQSNSINFTGMGETICVIDTGINYTHPDLGGCSNDTFIAGNCAKVIGGYDFINNDNNPMDDNGHGTHVAGTVAANGTITGVAPGARIIALKALDSSGSGSFGQVDDAINWCVTNSTLFNISVITMSIGTAENYSGYCDSLYSSTATAINAAIAKNITVTIATGNSGNTTGIASPSCIENSTSVAAVDKSDVMASFSNRNNLVDVTAPGVNINSTATSGSSGCASSSSRYKICSGTSMATPHIAGAIAIMQQERKLSTGRMITPAQVETQLRIFGDSKNDSSGSGLNFSRVNVYNSLDALGVPQFSSISSQNLNYSLLSHFNVTITDVGISDAWIDFNGTNYTAGNITHTGNLYKFNLSAAAGNYTLRWYANDTSNNVNSTALLNVTIEKISPSLNLTFLVGGVTYTSNITIDNDTTVNITATSIGEGIIYLYSNGSLIGSNSLLISNLTNFSIATYNITAMYNETQNYSGSSITYFITAQASNQPPIGYKISPADNNYTNNSTVIFRMNATDVGLANATLFLYNRTGGVIDTNNTNITGAFNSTNWTYILSDGNYSWNVMITDNRSNSNFTDSTNFTLVVDTTLPTAAIRVVDSTITTDETTYIYCNETSGEVNFQIIELRIDDSLKNSSTTPKNLSYLYDPSSSGSKIASCIAKDIAGNIHTNNRTITVSSTSSSGSSGSSGSSPGSSDSGSSAVTEPETANFVFPSLSAGQTVKVIPSSRAKEVMGIAAVVITMKTAATNVKIDVMNASISKVERSLEKTDRIYHYIQIEHTNLDNAAIEQVNITFEVKTSWLKANNVSKDNVTLKRYINGTGWEKLATKNTTETSTTITYKAQSKGLSFFAIAADTGRILISDAVNTTGTAASNETLTSAEKPKSKINWTFVAISAGAAVVVSLLLAAFILRNNKKGYVYKHSRK